MLKHDRTIIHVEVKDTREHLYFGSAAAMFEDSRVKNLLKIKYQTFRTKRVSAEHPFENQYLIVRKGNLGTIDHHAASGTPGLLEAMLSHADPSQVAGLSRFFKAGPGQYGEGDKFLGIKVPVTRAVVKEYCRTTPAFSELERCIGSEYHEVRLAALLALVEVFHRAGKAAARKAAAGDLRQRCVDFYLSHTQQINNWDLVDLSCHPLLGEWLLDKDRSILYDLARNGRSIWEQRIGIVSTMTFIRHGQLDDTFALADILLHHPHDLIHKAVGWLLREAGKRDKAALEAYLQGTGPSHLPRFRTMPRTMLRYAIEKFPEAERQIYLSK